MSKSKSFFLLLILLLALAFPIFWKSTTNKPFFSFMENFSNLGSSSYIQKVNEKYSDLSSDLLLKDSYPLTGRKCIGDDSAYQIWWHYPTFQEGSYDQITNNIRYNNNPDLGSCTPANICGMFYKEYQTKNNYVYPLPPLKPECGSRVNYYYSPINLLPFKAETANILY